MLEEVIKKDMIAAMKAGEPLKLSVLRMLQSEIGYKRIDVQRDLTDEDIISVLQKEVKKRREAVEAFKVGGRQEMMEKEQKELEILEKYLPKMMTEQDIKNEIVNSKILENISNFGEVMKVVAPKFKGRADGSLVAKIVKELVGS